MNRRHSNELDYFWAALMFYTRIPVPKHALHSQQVLNKSRKYFPLIGIIVGLIAASTYTVASFVFSAELSIALSLASGVLITGAFHEDGFADTCDGFGGGWTHDQVLRIMKDSLIGTYAGVGLLLLFGTKFLALIEIITFYVSGHTLSRAISSTMIDFFDYVQDIDKSKVKPITEDKLALTDVAVSMFITILPLIFLAALTPVIVILASLLSIAVGLAFMGYSRHRIGGYTGDVLGATQQLSELAFYLGFAACL